MKILYVLRHAKSDWNLDHGDDHSRPLNKRGIQSCVKLGHYFKKNNINPDIIFASTAVRAASTIQNIINIANPEKDITYTDKLYNATPGEVLKYLAKHAGEANSVMVVFHNPGAEQLTKLLCGSGEQDALEQLRTKYPTAGLATIELPITDFENIDPGVGHLRKFVIPNKL